MAKLQHCNDLDHLLDNFDEDSLKCPVCGKQYKQKTAFMKHMEGAVVFDCATDVDLFADTEVEEQANKFYMDKSFSRSSHNMNAFRKSKTYGTYIDYILFCMKYQINPDTYFTYIDEGYKDKINFKSLSHKVNFAMRDDKVGEFRRFLMENEIFIDSASFHARYEDALRDDFDFVIESIRKGHIGVNYLMDHSDLQDRVNNHISENEYQRFMSIFR